MKIQQFHVEVFLLTEDRKEAEEDSAENSQCPSESSSCSVVLCDQMIFEK
jgi:hypothetical protein